MDLGDLAELADAYYATREKRLEIDRQSTKLKEQETEQKAAILQVMAEHSVATAGGQLCVLKRRVKNTPKAKDWTKVYEYIKENDAFDLLQRRLNEEAVALRTEEGVSVPGIEFYPVDTLSVSKGPMQ